MSDPRFARLKSDPRFRRPRKKQAKVLIDDRFKEVFEQPKSKQSGRVDKYGRPITETHERDSLKRFYRLEDDATDKGPSTFADYARGEVLLESSDDEDEEELDKPGNNDSVGLDSKRPITVHEGSYDEVNLDESEFADLDAQAATYAKANPEPTQEDISPSRRLAVVNLDWDHVRAVHLFKICSSLVSLSSSSIDRKGEIAKGSSAGIVRGKVLSVHVYPSDFGKERMAREEKEGPPPEIFKKASDADEEVNAQNIYDVGGEDEYNKDALRQYQLERLRYYYAIITCDTVDAAALIYQELDGTELERSANVFDLSYVPDDMSFDDDFRDEATDHDSDMTFKSIDFVTDALRHSKVKLTWDEDDPERNQVTRRTLTKKEIDDGDFRAYLASDSDSEAEAVDTSVKNKDKKQSRNKLRALLLGGNDDLPEGWNHEDNPDDVDMEITFTPGLSEQTKDETTLDKYQRKMREKRKKRKEESKEKVHAAETGDDGDKDDFFDIGGDDGETNLSSRKDKSRKREEVNHSVRPLSTPEELALLVSSDNPTSETKHFDFKSVLKSEKKARRKGKAKKNDKDGDGNDNEAQLDFKIDVNDTRFKALYEDHQYAIDPTNPHFKKTTSMDAFLQERSTRRAGLVAKTSAAPQLGQSEIENKSLQTLVDSVKRKSALAHETNKRRKI